MFHYLKDYLIDSLEAPRGTSETTLMDLVLLWVSFPVYSGSNSGGHSLLVLKDIVYVGIGT